MSVQDLKTGKQIFDFLNKAANNQNDYEQKLNDENRKKNGVFLTNSLCTVENVLSVVDLNNDIFSKKILEPACGQGIFILKLLADIYAFCPEEILIANFISNNIYFVDIQKKMVEITKLNIKKLYYFLFEKEFVGNFNEIVADFTERQSTKTSSLFDNTSENLFANLYNSFDYVIGNPPYVTLYGRRDKKENEEQRVKYLQNYSQFPNTVKNGKINLVMLFLEHSLDLLKENGKLSFIVDVAFFETAYQYTRKYLLENSQINELQLNITDFEVASGQIVLKLTKLKPADNEVKIIDNKTQNSYFIPQKDWYNKDDEYKFRYNGCRIFRQIFDTVVHKKDKTILELFPHKNLRTCVMLLDMEDKFTFSNGQNQDENLVYPYYQGSKSLSEKFGNLSFSKYFYYDKPLQDKINDELKIELEKQGIKNKKRIGLGETVIYDNPKIFIRQSAKEIIATLDLKKGAANNSLYAFSLRDNSQKTIDFLYFLCGFLNSNFATYYAQQMNIIRFSQGKQPQIKISDLGSIFIPQNVDLQNKISNFCKEIYNNKSKKNDCIPEINNLIYNYYELNDLQKSTIEQSIKSF
ncbi:MAG: Eco57I restriction-modification methylase domain-containing protein [Prevotellaceae bacterium]|jgi:tRNA1(Val) A37 N6-methylase TrmN6|nr:Eco57I restriction-modification methylase domain-containing protein [Prevotellaceae bacterium]